MKRFFSTIFICALVLSLGILSACGNTHSPDADGTDTANNSTDVQEEQKALKLGLGVYATASATDAAEDKAGQGQVTATLAAVLVDNDDKIVKAFIDCADNKVSYTLDGKAVAADAFATKKEQGDAYGMVAYGGAAKEWYEQADAFCALIAGKTADEVKALVADDGKGTEGVISAGCTIAISDFALAVEKAVANATESGAAAADTLKIGAYTAPSSGDATEDKDGFNQVEITAFAAAIDANGKVTAASSDCLQVKFTFDIVGASTFDATKALATKKEQGDAYGMVAYGGAGMEWYAQAAAFDALCVGKSVAEIGTLVGADGYGAEDVVSAGCTIRVDGFARAASKLG